jgi:hypothetical protein
LGYADTKFCFTDATLFFLSLFLSVVSVILADLRSMLAERLNMPADRAEEWIVNLIRNARLDAAIDSKQGTVVMATQVPSIYHQVIEKTKSLHFRRSVPFFCSPSGLVGVWG